ncbi:MAG: alanine racemase [Oscillospiraceae bacterium]|nr:alanine racemase [Oscillospiraceae bacterium]
MERELRRTWAEIDLDTIENNYNVIRNKIGPDRKYLAVVKANAYGHGAVRVSAELEKLGADYFGVATFNEAKELREGGITKPILVLGHTPTELTDEIIKYDVTQSVSSVKAAKEYNELAAKCQKKLKVHIKVDSGMSRVGFLTRGEAFESGVEAIAEVCGLEWLDHEGIFTHFAVSDVKNEECEAYTRKQFATFVKTIDALKEKGINFDIRHCANSGATLNYPETYLDMVRPGICFYGAGDGAAEAGLKPIMTLKTNIYLVKNYSETTDVGYGRTWTGEPELRLGVLPVGYADGFMRVFSNKASLISKCGPVPVRGRVCMDMMMVDLTDAPDVGEGDELEIFGKNQTVDYMSAMAGTIPQELLCAVGIRVPRKYI